MEDQARIDIMTIIAQIVADHTEYPLAVEADNLRIIDQAGQADPYLKVEIDYLPGGGQLDMADNPLIKQVGQLALYAVVREGSGSAAANRLINFVRPYFELKTVGAVTFHAAQRARPLAISGWWYSPLWTDFWYTQHAK